MIFISYYRANVANEYAYDTNGNLTKDLNKNIASISYNVLNLPGVVSFSDGNSISYGYDASGNKLSVAYKVGSTTAKTEYSGNKVYKNGTFSMILTNEGYITLSGTTPTYHYYLKDHQGNNRVVIDQSGTVEQVNHYYPFGGLFGEGLQTSNQPYKYNGKELDRLFGLDMYDYGARNYDAAIARWWEPDPLAEVQPNKTPYHFVSNNPINRIDPTGMLDNPIYDEDGNFLGPDDKGLQGKAIVMNKDNFTQGMSHEDALSHSLGAKGLNEGGLDKLLSHKSTLSSRVDWKGYVTFGEAIDHYHYGNGEPLYVDLSKINFKSSRLSVDDFASRGTNSLSINFFMADTHPFNSNILWYPGESNLGNVFGTLRVNLESTNGSISLQNYDDYGGGFDRFDFNRADQFIADRLRRGGNPTPYNFYGYGRGSINLTKPKVHTLDNPGIKKPWEF